MTLIKKSLPFGAHELVLETGEIARQADGSVLARLGDTVVLVTVVGLVFLASVLRINVTSLLAGLGIGTLAFGLAAQDSVKNLFGSLTVIFDRPFHVGQWVKIGSHEGTVEEVGFRSTRIRTFYNSQVTLPNSRLTTAIVDNMGRRRYRRIKTMLSLQYDTKPEQMNASSINSP